MKHNHTAERSTDDLMKRIADATEGPMTVLRETEPFMTLPPLHEYLNELIEERHETPQRVFEKIGLERTMGHRIMAGSRQPSRNVLIRLAFELALTLEETQNLLQIGGKAVLYPRVRRDNLLIYALTHTMSIEEIEAQLQALGEKSLYLRC